MYYHHSELRSSARARVIHQLRRSQRATWLPVPCLRVFLASAPHPHPSSTALEIRERQTRDHAGVHPPASQVPGKRRRHANRRIDRPASAAGGRGSGRVVRSVPMHARPTMSRRPSPHQQNRENSHAGVPTWHAMVSPFAS